MDKPTRPPNTPPFVEPAFYVDPRVLARQTIEAAKALDVKKADKADNKKTPAKKD